MALMIPPNASGTEETAPLPIRVLFADDSSAMRTLARSYLTLRKGFSFAAAADGAEALAMFDAHRPDCVVLDIEMPGVGGFEALDELQRRCPEIPVVILSGFSDPILAGKAKERGAVAYLEKSREMRRLAETVRRVCRPVVAVPQAPSPVAAPEWTGASGGSDYAPRLSQAPARTSDSTTVAETLRLEYVISHDFAEPVRIMGGFAALLDKRHKSALDPSGQQLLLHLVEGSQRLQRMVDDLMVYSRAGRSVAHAEPVDLARLVVDVMAELAPLVGERRATVTAGHLPTVWGDVTMLRTVLQQVVTNGLTFNASVQPTVQIVGEVSGNSCVVTVTDNGIGVTPTHAKEVFELFRRLNTREEYPGTGTGLALCRRLLALQSGSISLGPAAVGGTVVTIILPTEHPLSANQVRDQA